VVSGAGAQPDVPPQTAVLDAMPDGVATFDVDWTITYVNPAGAALLGSTVATLLGRTIWVALPELGGTIFHTFLLHARGVGGRVTWRGFYAPTDRWLTATAVLTGRDLQVFFRESADHLPEATPYDATPAGEAAGDTDADRDRLRFLAEVSESMISTLDTGESTARLAELVVPRLCDWAVVSLIGEDGADGEQARAHRDPARRVDLDIYLDGQLRGTADDSAFVAALRTGEPVQLAPLDQSLVEPSLATEEVRAAWRRLDTTSCTIVPLRARGETFGALSMLNSGERPAHTEMEIATAVEVARRGGLALDNARLYGRQLKVAETLQRSLLSPPPQPDHLEIAVRYRPAASFQQVGGDWYDAFQQSDGATLLVIGDVVGHNVDAAAAMGQIRSIVRGLAYDRPDSPARTLSRVDGVLTGLQVDTMATALLARIEQTDEEAAQRLRTLRWSSAGHLPPLLAPPDGEIQVLNHAPERLLGAASGATRSDHVTVMEPGATLILYTDGLVEHGRIGIDDGIQRLTAVLDEGRGLPLDALCDHLLDRIVTDRADDDIAILAVRFHLAPPN
jgi:serine phosphatase RsbU (regulator of sigma subunit)